MHRYIVIEQQVDIYGAGDSARLTVSRRRTRGTGFRVRLRLTVKRIYQPEPR